MLSGEAKHLKLTSPKVPSTLPHSRGEECMWNWPPQLGSWERRKKLCKLLSKWTRKTLWNTSSAFRFCSPPPCCYILHIGARKVGGGRGNLLSLPSRKHLKSFWLDEKFNEESWISLLLLPVLLPDFPSCFSWMSLFSKCVPRLPNGLQCPSGPPLLIPRHPLELEAGPCSVFHTYFWLLSLLYILS